MCTTYIYHLASVTLVYIIKCNATSLLFYKLIAATSTCCCVTTHYRFSQTMSAIPNTEQYFNRTPISSNPVTASGWLARDGSDFSFSTNSIPPISQTQCRCSMRILMAHKYSYANSYGYKLCNYVIIHIQNLRAVMYIHSS